VPSGGLLITYNYYIINVGPIIWSFIQIKIKKKKFLIQKPQSHGVQDRQSRYVHHSKVRLTHNLPLCAMFIETMFVGRYSFGLLVYLHSKLYGKKIVTL